MSKNPTDIENIQQSIAYRGRLAKTELLAAVTAPGNYKNQDKIDEYIASEKEKRKKTAADCTHAGEVFEICVVSGSDVLFRMSREDNADIALLFYQFWSETFRSPGLYNTAGVNPKQLFRLVAMELLQREVTVEPAFWYGRDDLVDIYETLVTSDDRKMVDVPSLAASFGFSYPAPDDLQGEAQLYLDLARRANLTNGQD